MDGGTETTTKNEPWGPQGEELKKFYTAAGEQYGQPLEYFPGSTVGGRDRQSIIAGDLTAGLGQQEYRQAGQKYIGQVLGGDFMGGNPHLDAMFDQMSQRITQNYQRVVAPGVNSSFGRAGRAGSSAHGLSMGAAQGRLADSLSDAGTRIYYNDYEQRTADRMEALGLSTGIQNMEYQDINQMRSQGVIEEDYTQRLLNDSIARFNFAQTEPEQRLDRYGQRITGNLGFGTTTSSTSGGGGGGAALGLGILSTLASAAGTFYGGPAGGMAAGALVGSLTGAPQQSGVGTVQNTANQWGVGNMWDY